MPAPEGPNPELLAAEERALAAYRAALASLYAAEREAGLAVVPAPRDPDAPQDESARGARLRVDAVILSVRRMGDRTEVKFARGTGDDPAAWKDEATALADGGFELQPGTVASLEAVFAPGKKPAWTILKASPR